MIIKLEVRDLISLMIIRKGFFILLRTRRFKNAQNGEVDRDEHTRAQEWTVDTVTDATGAPANVFYKLKLNGRDMCTKRMHQLRRPYT